MKHHFPKKQCLHADKIFVLQPAAGLREGLPKQDGFHRITGLRFIEDSPVRPGMTPAMQIRYVAPKAPQTQLRVSLTQSGCNISKFE
ncbi:hypothetical protein TMES_15980 [Thalassospira mesophila]|uniref:Uncharacterized protein n=1 Tax=Thalassospira mesophila TaxID=1293891 RepID=A0A1Y2KZ39_9PROT|nr:hypothetical protein TMES_15980 [Thalassospira mesophila]